MFDLFLNDEYRVTQRAAWPISYCVIAHPQFIAGKFNQLIYNLKKPGIHNAIKRNTVRLLQAVAIPEEYEGEIMNLCFRYVEDPAEAVAVKAFSLSVLGRLAIKYPDIIPEIQLLIHEQLSHQTAAFKRRAEDLLKRFEQ